ncbi:MAG: LytTR family DNA-binding domain-containing protein [Bacteroidota bacterium]
MKIQCIIIDDEPLAIQVIQSHLAPLPEIEVVDSFQDPTKAFEVLNQGKIDLVFLDIEMPQLSGLELIKTIPPSVKVIFTTAFRNYALESYDLDAVDYLLKPISFSRLYKAINKYKSSSNLPVSIENPQGSVPQHDHLYVNSNKKFIKINFDDIDYVESMKDYVRIFTLKENTITKDTIANFEKKLPRSFLRIHRSYIVNTLKITAFTKMDVELGQKEIPIGASYKKQVLAFLKKDNI